MSAVVAQEIAAAPPRVQEVYRSLPDENVDETFFDAKARSLFVGYVRAGFVTPRVANDAFHVATATAAGAFAIVSWNFRDIVHPDKMRWYNGINVALGFPALKIVSPREVIRLVE